MLYVGEPKFIEIFSTILQSLIYILYRKQSYIIHCICIIFRVYYSSALPTLQKSLRYRKHQHRAYTFKNAQTVYTANKLTISVYCNYNSWQLSKFNTLYFIINYDHVNILI